MEKLFKQFKKADKTERVEILENNMDKIVTTVLSGDFNGNPLKDGIYEFLLSKKFCKALKKYVDNGSANIGLVPVLSDACRMITEDTDPMVAETFNYCLDEILRRRVKQVAKEVGLPKPLVKNILLDCPETVENKSRSEQFIYIKRVIRKLYVIGRFIDSLEDAADVRAKLYDAKTVTKIFGEVIGEEVMGKVTSVILLENIKNAEVCEKINEDAKVMWNILTDVALISLEYSGKKKEIADWLEKFYIKRRRKDKDVERGVSRRVNFLEVKEEEYKRIAKAVSILTEQDSANEAFLA